MEISSEILLPLLTNISKYFMKIILSSMLTEYFFYRCPIPVFFIILLHGSLIFQCLFQSCLGQLFFRESPSTKSKNQNEIKISCKAYAGWKSFMVSKSSAKIWGIKVLGELLRYDLFMIMYQSLDNQ